MNPGPEADSVLLAHMRDCLDLILYYTNAERSRFDASRQVQDAVIRNLQTLAESSQRLSSEIKGTKPQIPWRELAGFRGLIVHGQLGVDLGAVWLVVEQDLPALTAAVEPHDRAARPSRLIRTAALPLNGRLLRPIAASTKSGRSGLVKTSALLSVARESPCRGWR